MSQVSTPANAQSETARPTNGILRRIFRTREIGVLVALLALILVMSIASPYFLTTQHVFNVARGMSTIGIMAIGMTISRL